MYVYIFSATLISVIYKINQNNNETRSGTTGTGIGQTDLQINEKTEKEKNAKKLVEKRTRALNEFKGALFN